MNEIKQDDFCPFGEQFHEQSEKCLECDLYDNCYENEHGDEE